VPTLVLPRLQFLWLSSRLVGRLARVDPDCVRPLAAAGFHEDSMVFLTEGRIQRMEYWKLSDWLEAHPHGLALLEERPFISGPDVERLAAVRGFNYSNGRTQLVALVQTRPGSRDARSAAGAAAPASSAAETPPPPSRWTTGTP